MGSSLAAIVLAAGEGKRMRSQRPKVLHTCGDWPLVAHVVKAVLARRAAPVVVVVGPQGEAVRESLGSRFSEAPLEFAVQHEPLGTGDAARAGLDVLRAHKGRVLVVCGDVPLLRPETLKRLETESSRGPLALLTAKVADPSGYGRVLRKDGRVVGIVEHKDATPAQRAINEVNVGVYLADAGLLASSVAGLACNNAQGEFYLTDMVAAAAADGGARAVAVPDVDEIRGVNTPAELAEAELTLRRRLIIEHQARGVRFLDVHSVILGADVVLAKDVEIGPGVQLYEDVRVGPGARIEGPTLIRNTRIGAGTVVHAFSHLEGAEIGKGVSVGPFARLRPGTELATGAKIGNFVETKKTRLGAGAKANHLAYLGDAEVGARANIGAGTITCNYDGGPVKHQTRVGRDVFVGSNATLVAPVELGDGTFVAAGSTITQDAAKDTLAFGRARQVNREGYAKHLRERIKGASKKK